MNTYETPTITEIGSVAEMTQANFRQLRFDGFFTLGSDTGTPTS